MVSYIIYNVWLCVFLGRNAEEEFSEGSSLSDWSPSPSRASQGSSSGSDSTKARKRQLVEGPLDSNVARDAS